MGVLGKDSSPKYNMGFLKGYGASEKFFYVRRGKSCRMIAATYIYSSTQQTGHFDNQVSLSMATRKQNEYQFGS